jgi:hypothetical protein
MVKRLLFILLSLSVTGCKVMGVAEDYSAPADGELSQLFIYTPNTDQKNVPSVAVRIDKKTVGDLAENRPLQSSTTPGWHTISIHRQSTLGAREELASVNALFEKDIIYYVRYSRTGAPNVSIVDEDTGRQMR